MSVITRSAVLILATMAMLACPVATPSHADAKCDPTSEYCEISDGGDGSSGPGGDGGGGKDKSPEPPLCSAFARGVPDNPPEDDWVWVECRLLPGQPDLIGLWVPPRESAEQLAWAAIARLQLRPVEIGLTPLDPDVMTAVGIPVWLWVDNPSRASWGPASITAGGISLTAHVSSVSWAMGDGTVVQCGRGTPWRSSMVDRNGMVGESPTCGHVYDQQGRYVVRAVAHWVAEWRGYGESGTIRLDLASTRVLGVGEIQVIVTRR
jgi:hypothetical protein